MFEVYNLRHPENKRLLSRQVLTVFHDGAEYMILQSFFYSDGEVGQSAYVHPDGINLFPSAKVVCPIVSKFSVSDEIKKGWEMIRTT